MALFKKKQRADPEAEKLKSFLDMIAPSLVKFEFDRYFCGNSIRCVWALREYPASTESQAILRHLGEKSGVTLRIYCRQVSPGEEDRITNLRDTTGLHPARSTTETTGSLTGTLLEICTKACKDCDPALAFTRTRDGSKRVSP